MESTRDGSIVGLARSAHAQSGRWAATCAWRRSLPWFVVGAVCAGPWLVGCSCSQAFDLAEERGRDAGAGARVLDECGNGLDDDGDSMVDEGCFCGPGETQDCYPYGPLGACGAGEQTCLVMGSAEWGRWSRCDAAPEPAEERCEGALDEDCDGSVDEGCPCAEGATTSCAVEFESRSEPCQPGMQVCMGGAWTSCQGAVLPQPEVCGDGVDNDCDGEIDDRTVCDCSPAPELCDNGLDDDCDGVVDEPEACSMCRPELETCGDGIDQDCDGRDAVCDAGAGDAGDMTREDAGAPLGPVCGEDALVFEADISNPWDLSIIDARSNLIEALDDDLWVIADSHYCPGTTTVHHIDLRSGARTVHASMPAARSATPLPGQELVLEPQGCARMTSTILGADGTLTLPHGGPYGPSRGVADSQYYYYTTRFPTALWRRAHRSGSREMIETEIAFPPPFRGIAGGAFYYSRARTTAMSEYVTVAYYPIDGSGMGIAGGDVVIPPTPAMDGEATIPSPGFQGYQVVEDGANVLIAYAVYDEATRSLADLRIASWIPRGPAVLDADARSIATELPLAKYPDWSLSPGHIDAALTGGRSDYEPRSIVRIETATGRQQTLLPSVPDRTRLEDFIVHQDCLFYVLRGLDARRIRVRSRALPPRP